MQFGHMRSSPSRIGKTASLKNVTGVTRNQPAAAFLRPDVHALAAGSARSSTTRWCRSYIETEKSRSSAITTRHQFSPWSNPSLRGRNRAFMSQPPTRTDTSGKGHPPRRRANHLSVLRNLPADLRLAKAENGPARKNSFRERFQRRAAGLLSTTKFSSFVFTEIMYDSRPSCLAERDVRAVVTIREVGMRWPCGLAVHLMHGRTSLCGREIVWSWSPGAETKPAATLTRCAGDGGNRAGPRGEHV